MSETDENIEEKEVKRRNDHDRNQKIIRNFIIKYVKKNDGVPPTMTEISEGTELSYKTVWRHSKAPLFDRTESPLRSFTPEVIMSIKKSSENGNSASQKLWMQIMEGWSEKHEIDHQGMTPVTKVEVQIVKT